MLKGGASLHGGGSRAIARRRGCRGTRACWDATRSACGRPQSLCQPTTAPAAPRRRPQCSFFEHRAYKTVYRRYASLFFIVGVDGEEVRVSGSALSIVLCADEDAPGGTSAAARGAVRPPGAQDRGSDPQTSVGGSCMRRWVPATRPRHSAKPLGTHPTPPRTNLRCLSSYIASSRCWTSTLGRSASSISWRTPMWWVGGGKGIRGGNVHLLPAAMAACRYRRGSGAQGMGAHSVSTRRRAATRLLQPCWSRWRQRPCM
jgi:hypothetical protein